MSLHLRTKQAQEGFLRQDLFGSWAGHEQLESRVTSHRRAQCRTVTGTLVQEGQVGSCKIELAFQTVPADASAKCQEWATSGLAWRTRIDKLRVLSKGCSDKSSRWLL
jgi:hypothetical protein